MVRLLLLRVVALAAMVTGTMAGPAAPPVSEDKGVKAGHFDISQVVLEQGRLRENEDRTLNYLKFIDLDRLLYNFRATHKLSTRGAQPLGGWDEPSFPFRSHVQGHFLSAWSQCWASLRDEECRERATSFVRALQECQDNNEAAGFAEGYLAGFPEGEFDKLEAGTKSDVIYYALHKTMAGLLDVWRNVGDETAESVLLGMARWVDRRTARLSRDKMQEVLRVEYGGMQDVLAEVYRQTGDERWIGVAQRFDQEATNSWLAQGEDRLSGLHANTNIPKWVGAMREYQATGSQRYLDIARNAWGMVVGTHTYAPGGNSQNERFRPPDAIAAHLEHDTMEHCNTYNMLKLTLALWTAAPEPAYFDFYERALQNHVLGAQDPRSEHGHVTYFSPLEPGARKGIGPVWGGGTWSTDDESFWCCQGSGLEQNTRLMDGIYGFDGEGLYVNSFAPSTLDWAERGVRITQTGELPASDSVHFTVSGSGSFAVRIRVPSWASGARIAVNGEAQDAAAEPGRYATVAARDWVDGDRVTVKMTMRPYVIRANDDDSVGAVAYGPLVLIGDYGDDKPGSTPTIDLGSVKRACGGGVQFSGRAEGRDVRLVPWRDGGVTFNYVTYWKLSGRLDT